MTLIVAAGTTPLVGPDTTDAVRGLLATVLVLALVGVLAWLARRGTLTWPGRRGTNAVTIETAVPVGERRSLVIVSVEGRRLLLGMTPSTISLVTELSAAGSFGAALEQQTTGREGSA